MDPARDTGANAPQSWNLYAYVRDNPANGTDPTGRVLNFSHAFWSSLQNSVLLRAAFEAYRSTESGSNQLQSFRIDSATTYSFDTAVTYNVNGTESWGQTGPPLSDLPKSGPVKVDLTTPTVNLPRFQAYAAQGMDNVTRKLAETLFHEGEHALDLGRGTMTIHQIYARDTPLQNETDPKLIQFLKELDKVLKSPQPKTVLDDNALGTRNERTNPLKRNP